MAQNVEPLSASGSSGRGPVGRLIWPMAVLLAVLHHDWWWWNDPHLVFGFLPIGLAWQMLFSIMAGLLWAVAVKFAWPSHIEAWAEGHDDAPAVQGGHR